MIIFILIYNTNVNEEVHEKGQIRGFNEDCNWTTACVISDTHLSSLNTFQE